MQDNVNASIPWVFDAEVTDAFDDMLKRSIPQYEVMRKAVFDLGCTFVKSGTHIVDLGCSRGEALEPFVSRFGAHNRFVGVEISKPMLAASRERFKGYMQCGLVDVLDMDLRKEYPPVNASVTLAVLTLQFTPIEYRQRILSDIYAHTLPGGALILVEKVLGQDSMIDRAMVSAYRNLKADHGYSQEQIERKAMSLEGVLVPVTSSWNADLLRQAGFMHIDCFWRWMNFAAWIAVR